MLWGSIEWQNAFSDPKTHPWDRYCLSSLAMLNICLNHFDDEGIHYLVNALKYRAEALTINQVRCDVVQSAVCLSFPMFSNVDEIEFHLPWALGEHLVSKILKSWHVQARSNKDLINKICLETSWLDQIHLYTRSWKHLSKIWRSWKDYESQWSLPKIFNETDSDTTSEQISKLFRIPWLFNRNILK